MTAIPAAGKVLLSKLNYIENQMAIVQVTVRSIRNPRQISGKTNRLAAAEADGGNRNSVNRRAMISSAPRAGRGKVALCAGTGPGAHHLQRSQERHRKATSEVAAVRRHGAAKPPPAR
jgi:hypothetical protein